MRKRFVQSKVNLQAWRKKAKKKTLTTWQPGASSRNHSKRLGKGMFDQSQSLPKPCLRHFSICQPDSWLEYLSYLCTKSLTSLTIPRSRNGPVGKHRSTSMWYVVGAIWVQRQRLTTIWKKEGFVSANAAPMPNIPDRYILLFFRFYMYTSTFYRTIEYAICIYIYILYALLINLWLFSVLLSSQIHISFNSTFNWNARASPFSDSLECCLSQELVGKTEVWAHRNRQHNFAYFPQPLKSEVPLGYIKSLSKKPSWSSVWDHKS